MLTKKEPRPLMAEGKRGEAKSLYRHYNKKFDLQLLKRIGETHPNRIVSFIAMGLAKRLKQELEVVL